MDTKLALSSDERTALQFMREEEKLARDVYLSLYSLWRLPVFSNIAASEQRHTEAVQGLLQTYGIPDPVTTDRVGTFTNPELTSLYADLVARGRQSAYDALQVGALIEETDITDLQNALSKTAQPDIARVYSNLMQASHRHLRAFTGQLQSRSGAYAAQVMQQTEVDAIIGVSAYPATRTVDGNVTRMGGGRRMGQGRNQAATGHGGGMGNGNRRAAVMPAATPAQPVAGFGCDGGRRHRGGW
ncbi:DUF2202 domain-containing protein [Thiothrix nivea]|uniref:DUF2202 domain-containing protein n=1 Tax=Thiothrix nivea (strain ATCC 35100 / DSM 5205 / JP2) TaxID=870187 RepID=A0A656HB48_THINJ|nr:DUF2202 domain-containing protein [Thiothrix nivea]EIJ33577.1 Protein of unknown function DUF2202 [Thiothrix nivea DSM 5205]